MTNPFSQNVARAISRYISGLGITVASNTTLTIAAGHVVDSTLAFDVKVNFALTLNAAAVGANGIDTGVLGASTVYSVYIISQGAGFSAPACLLSTSATPILPVGYDTYIRIGYAVTDGSSHFLAMYQFGNGLTREYLYDAPINVLNGGTASTYTAVSLAGVVPAVSTIVKFNAGCAPTAAGNTAVVRPSGSASTTFCTINGAVAATIQWEEINVPSLVVSNAAKVDYIVTGALTLLVMGFIDYL